MKRRSLVIMTVVLICMNYGASAQGDSWGLKGNFVDDTRYIGTNNEQSLVFKTNKLRRAVITKNGTFGIGITTTNFGSGTLQLSKSKPTSSLGSAKGQYLQIGTGETGYKSYWEIGFGFLGSDEAHPPAVIAFQQTQKGGSGWTAGDLVFGTRAATSNTAVSERMRITSDGDIGIGTTKPAEKLHVDGNICYTGTSSACSDIRYKRNITALDGALGKVIGMEGVNYYWKKGEFPDLSFNSKKQIGFVAQEIELIYPELVLTDKSGYKSIDYSRLTPILVEAMKEQQAIIEKQAAQIEKMNERLEKLEAKSSYATKY